MHKGFFFHIMHRVFKAHVIFTLPKSAKTCYDIRGVLTSIQKNSCPDVLVNQKGHRTKVRKHVLTYEVCRRVYKKKRLVTCPGQPKKPSDNQ